MEEHENDLEVIRQHLKMAKAPKSTKQHAMPMHAVASSILTTKQLQYVFNLPPLEFVIVDFMKKKA